MRMRKKKNLEARLADCDNLIIMQTENLDFRNTENKLLDYEKIFGNRNPVHLEIGCGKGKFSAEIARRNPDINFIAVEKSANVTVTACENAAEIKNLCFLLGAAEYLPRYIPQKSVERIYLNFSCPFPKNAYAAHRLTNARFLKIYKPLMTAGAEIHQKTDNTHFFEYSIEQFSGEGFALKNVTFDLHNSDYEGNIMTEYEERFSALGQPIYRLEAYIKGDSEKPTDK